jgi:hypothetical protein
MTPVSGGAGEFERHAIEQGIAYDGLQARGHVAATMDVSEMIMAGRLAVDDPLLDHSNPHGGEADGWPRWAFRFSRGESLGPIDAIEAMLWPLTLSPSRICLGCTEYMH